MKRLIIAATLALTALSVNAGSKVSLDARPTSKVANYICYDLNGKEVGNMYAGNQTYGGVWMAFQFKSGAGHTFHNVEFVDIKGKLSMVASYGPIDMITRIVDEDTAEVVYSRVLYICKFYADMG